ncbi:MAG: hypothetical protein IKZ98_12750 [Clostridia bacterium]|nr:hypothetical protein [Clostridia bacterium]
MEIYHPRDEELLREMKRVRRSDRRRRLSRGLAILLTLSIAVGLFVFHRYYQLAVAHGTGMGDTLPEGSLVLVRKPEAGQAYNAGDIILFEKRLAKPVELTILSPKGKTRRYCRYVLYRDVGTTRQYYASTDNGATWIAGENGADLFESTEEGTVSIGTENLKNGEYWLKEVQASYGQALLKDPIPFAVVNPVKTQFKRVLACPGERVVLSPYAETRVNGLEINTEYTSGRTEDAAPEGRRLIMAKDRYFVQGDQLSLSVDSRETDYSTVSDGEILGRAEFALWPLQCFGNLTGRQVTIAGTETEAME